MPLPSFLPPSAIPVPDPAPIGRRGLSVRGFGIRNCWPSCRACAMALLIGSYAQVYYLGERKATLTGTLRPRREYLPHLSPHNQMWRKRDPWFASEVIPYLRRCIQRILGAD